jgi:hypothetical protein
MHELSSLRLPNSAKEEILSIFFHWEKSMSSADSSGYAAYLSYFENQCRNAKQNDHPHYNTHSREIIFAVVKQLQARDHRESLRVTRPLKVKGQEEGDYSKPQIDSIVHLVARLWLMIHIGTVSQGVTGQTQISWLSGSVQDLLANHFRHETILTDSVKLEKVFNACNIERMADVKIHWTPNLLDHLRFNEDGKKPILNIFYCVGFLELQRDKYGVS